MHTVFLFCDFGPNRGPGYQLPAPRVLQTRGALPVIRHVFPLGVTS